MMRFRAAAAILSAAVVLAATLYPAYGAASDASPWCITCEATWLADLVGNVILFLPLGAALVLVGLRPVAVLAVGALLSAGIELTQLAVPGRTPALRDLLANGAGAWVGALLFRSAPRWLSPGGGLRRPLGAAALLAACAAILLGGWLSQPALPPDVLRASWLPETPGRPGPYRGRLLDAFVGGSAVADGEVLPPSVRMHVRPGVDRISLRVGWLGRPYGRRVLFALTEPDGTQYQALDVLDHHAVQVVRSRGSVIGLRPRETWIRDVVPPERDVDVVRLTLARRSASICAVANGRRRCAATAPVGRGWVHIQAESSVPEPLLPLADGIWLLALFLPAGLWLRGLLVPAAAAVMLALAALPPLAGMAPATPWEAAAAVFGLALGGVLQPALARRASRSGSSGAPPGRRPPPRLSARRRRQAAMRR